MNEQVMVVRREELEPYIGARRYDLILEDTDTILNLIETKHFFIDRPLAENSPQYKQIIPYVVIRSGGDTFLLKRTTGQTEARLHHKMSIGIGGHINPDTPTVLGGLQKELDEEIAVERPFTLKFVGILNDDTTDVGAVHLGAVFLLETSSRNVTVRETEKMTGSWAGPGELAAAREAMETWSQIVYDRYVGTRHPEPA